MSIPRSDSAAFLGRTASSQTPDSNRASAGVDTNIGTPEERTKKKLVLEYFKRGWYTEQVQSDKKVWIRGPDSAPGSKLRGYCTLCDAAGELYSCIVTQGVKETTFGNNATTALNHLDTRHAVSPGSPEFVARDVECNMNVMYVYRHINKGVERGLGHNIYDEKEYTDGLKFKANAKLVRRFVQLAANQTLSHVAHTLRQVGGQVSLIFDSGTIDRIQTLKCLITHVELRRCFTSFLLKRTDPES